MSTWLDTETKALLQQIPPEKFAPPDTGTFTLVLLEKGRDVVRVAQSLARVSGVREEKVKHLVSQCCPVPVASSLSMADALLAQFELVCCDSVSVFLKDEVVSSASRSYLTRLYSQFKSSPEFDDVIVTVSSIPKTDQGIRVVDQFFGGVEWVSCDVPAGYSYRGIMKRKKARILTHWAKKIGGEVTIAGDK
jgi:hypothetical protein